MVRVFGREEQVTAHAGDVANLAAQVAIIDISNQRSRGRGARALPELQASLAIRGREHQDTTHIRQIASQTGGRESCRHCFD